MSIYLFRDLVADAAGVVGRVAVAVRDADSLAALGRRLGWNLDEELAPITVLALQARTVGELFLTIDDASAEADWLALASAVTGVYGAIVALEGASFGAELDAAGFAAEFPEQLLHWAVIDHVDRARPRVGGALRALGFISTVAQPAAGIRPAYEDTRFTMVNFGELLASPSAWLRQVWAWGDPSFDGDAMLDRLAELFGQMGIAAGFARLAPSTAEDPDPPAGAMRMHLMARLIRGYLPAGDVEFGVELVAFEESAGPVIAIVPYAEGAVAAGITFAGLHLVVSGLATAGERGLLVRPDSVEIADDPLSTEREPVEGALTFTLSKAAGAPEQMNDGPVQVTTSGWQLTASGKGDSTGGSELWIELLLPNVKLALPAAASGFVGAAVGSASPQVPSPLTLGLSSTRGLYLGPNGLIFDRTMSLRLGALELRRISVLLAGVHRGVAAEVRTALAVKLGPVQLMAEGLGVSLTLAFPEDGGNVGPVDLGADVLLPTGFGVAIDTAVARGAGQVARIGAAEYRGALALDVLGAKVSAFGILDDSPDGGSFVAAIAATFPSIPIGLGFTVDGLGGLIGVHRRVDFEALSAALRGSGIENVFFAQDTAAQAARVLTDLATYFPAAQGRYIFGPAAKIGWGTPTIVEATVALLLEVPAPVRLVLLGNISAALPSRTYPIIELNLDVLGDVDVARRTLAIDATLHDSQVAGFPITGDMALRMGWGDPPSFAMSVGGFHSQFRVPPGFPALRPIKIPIGSGDNPRLDITGFLTLTSNTAQVGAQIDLYAAAGPLNIVGNAGFEALLQFLPFAFQADLWGGVALRRGSTVLASVHLDGTLRGPTPWHIAGEACLSLWFVDLCVGFAATFGQPRDAELPSREIWPLLEEALEDPRSWSTPLPVGVARAVVTAVPVDGEAATRIDPGAALAVRQKVVPLDRTIERFGHVRPSGADRFQLSSAAMGTTVIATPGRIHDWFAPAQFEALSDAERLSRPGYEKMVAGATLAADVVTTGAELIAPVEYETFIFPSPTPAPEPYSPTVGQQIAGTDTAANANAPLRQPRAPTPLVTLAEEAFVIASTDDLAPRFDLIAAGPRGAVELALRKHLADNPAAAGSLQVVPRFEAIA